jgi:hypothetical protein
VDTLIVVPNQRLLEVASPDTTFATAFRMADGVLLRAVRAITDLILTPGLVNLDFADVCTVRCATPTLILNLALIRPSRSPSTSPLLSPQPLPSPEPQPQTPTHTPSRYPYPHTTP